MANDLNRFFDRVAAWAEAHPRFGKFLAFGSLAVALPLIGVLLAPRVLVALAPRLDPADDLYAVNRPLAFTFLDAQGNEIGHRGAVVGARLKLEEMPAYLPAAFLAMEDRRFYDHAGLDVKGFVRALWTDLRARRWVAGGSSITQQTAKIVYTDQSRNFGRKIQEMFDTASLEKSLSKKEILELYLNRLYLGSGAFGVDGAARVYFNKSARDVTIAETAMLVTLTRAPSVFTPRRDLERAQRRARVVLNSMVETGVITEAQADEARAHPAVIADRHSQDARNYFLDAAASEATALATVGGVKPSTDLVVHTTMDAALQEAARTSAAGAIARDGKRLRASQAAVVVMKPDGAVAAMIGGVDYGESVFNRAAQARRQPGSSFKPFVYLAALEAGITPWEYRDDQPVNINGWTPANYGGRAYGTLTLADALAHSVNTIAANLGQEVGIPAVVAAARRAGITSPLEPNASLALGTAEVTPVELTTAYAAFANGGLRVYPYMVTQVDAAGKTIYRRAPPQPQRIIAQHVDRDLTAMLFGVVTSGTGTGARLAGHEAAGKTGTTQDYHDAWFVGFTADYVTAVWVGNDDNKPMRGVTGGGLPASIWRSVMTAAERGLPSRALERSSQPEIDPYGVMASGVEPPVPGDDESQQAAMGDAGPGAPPPPPPEERRRRGLFDWLFGRDGEERGAPPPDGQRGDDR